MADFDVNHNEFMAQHHFTMAENNRWVASQLRGDDARSAEDTAIKRMVAACRRLELAHEWRVL